MAGQALWIQHLWSRLAPFADIDNFPGFIWIEAKVALIIDVKSVDPNNKKR